MPLSKGDRLGPYEILAQIGAGGMGEVYKARDTRLDRIVAVKTSKDQFSERFDREVRAVAALNHPNICTLHDVGPNYLVMEYVEGHPAKGPIPIDQALHYAVQIADALQAAHAKDIVHRDIKPDNVFVTDRGQIKVLDFGLAKQSLALESDETIEDTLTLPGTAVGTASYMSPEQALGKSVDGRSDLWSLGVVLYGMVTGSRPFEGQSVTAILEGVLGNKPVPVHERNPKVPQELERIIGNLLEKDREKRYASAALLLLDLKELEEKVRSRRIDESAVPRAAWVSYGIATAALVMVIGGFSLWWQQKLPQRKQGVERASVMPSATSNAAPPVEATVASAEAAKAKSPTAPATLLTNKDLLVLADFTNTTGEVVFDGILHEALAIELEQSPFLKIMGDERMRQDLQLMGHKPEERITDQIAREICQREGETAMLSGSIVNLGKLYVLTFQATNCKTGEAMAREKAEAADKEHVLQTVSIAATPLRRKLGESLSSVRQRDEPLDQVTTSSLEAFQAYSEGHRRFLLDGTSAANVLVQRATELDPNFAMAWKLLGNMGGIPPNPKGVEAYKKAFALIDHVSQRERLAITALYYHFVMADRTKAIGAYQLWARTYPRDGEPHHGLGIVFSSEGDLENAAREYKESIRIEPWAEFMYTRTLATLIDLDRFEEAKATAEAGLALSSGRTSLHSGLLHIAYVQGDRVAALRETKWFSGKTEEYQSLNQQASNAISLGQRSKMTDLRRRAAELSPPRPAELKAKINPSTPGPSATEEALLGNCEPSRGRRPVGLELALCGDSAQAVQAAQSVQTLQASIERALVAAPQIPTQISDQVSIQRAAIELAQDQPAKVLEILGPPTRYKHGSATTVYLRGLADLKLHKDAEAAAEFQKILDHKGENWGLLYAVSYVSLARSEELAGNKSKAKKAYEDFFTLWKDADPDIPILIAARKEYASLR